MEGDLSTTKDYGIIPRAVQWIFDKLEASEVGGWVVVGRGGGDNKKGGGNRGISIYLPIYLPASSVV